MVAHGSCGRTTKRCARRPGSHGGVRMLGIRHQRTERGCPWPNGQVERFIGTVKRALAGEPIVDRGACTEALRDIRAWYNHEQPHDYLCGRTPAEGWVGIDVLAAPPRTGGNRDDQNNAAGVRLTRVSVGRNSGEKTYPNGMDPAR